MKGWDFLTSQVLGSFLHFFVRSLTVIPVVSAISLQEFVDIPMSSPYVATMITIPYTKVLIDILSLINKTNCSET